MSEDVPTNVVNFDNATKKKVNKLKELLADEESLDITLFGNDEVITEMNKKHAFIQSLGGRSAVMCNIYDVVTGQTILDFRSPESILVQYSNQTAHANGKVYELGKFWLKHANRRDYQTIIFDPNAPTEHMGCYNVWQGLPTVPAKGSWKYTRKHIWKILCNKEKAKFKYVIRWIAWALQNPGKPAEVAVVFKGKQGAGKGFIFSQLVDIFGPHGMCISNRKHLTGQFNSHLAKTVFLFADEAYHPGDKEVEGALKQLITEKKIPIEGKFRDTMLGKNCLHIGMASNEEWVIPAAADSRRFFINEVDNRLAMGQATDRVRKHYFDRLWGEMATGGREALAYDLTNMDLKGWHPRDGMPDTEALGQQKELSLPRADKALLYMLDEGIWPGAKDEKGHYRVSSKALLNYLEEVYPEIKKVSTVSLLRTLAQFDIRKIHTPKGNVWEFPPLDRLRAKWVATRFKREFIPPDDWRMRVSEY
jgi:hypothetical protein